MALDEAIPSLGSQPQDLSLVITSYSIHYTKLYDAFLKSAIADQDKVDVLIAKMLTHTGSTAKLWDALAQDPQLKEVVPDSYNFV